MNGFGQIASLGKIEYDSTTTVLLFSGESKISKKELKTGFTIRLSDTSAKLISFSMVYLFNNNSTHGLQQITFYNNRGFIDAKYPKIDQSVGFVTLEHVHFERNGKRFRAKDHFLPIK